MIRNTLRLIAVAVVCAAQVTVFGTAAHADGCDACQLGQPMVSANQAQGAFDVSGAESAAFANLIPGGSAACVGCNWAAVPVCTIIDYSGGSICSGAFVGCTRGFVRFRIYLQRPAQSWQFVASECLGRPPATPRIDIGALAQRFFQQMPLPLPHPSFQPPGGTLVNLRTIFSAGAAAPITGSFQLGPITVTVTARPSSWTWTFEPGATQAFPKPGGRYPDEEVTYVYRSLGTRYVQVTATWVATFTVGTSTAVTPVAGTVSRTSTLQVPVRQALPVLVSQ